MGSFYQNQPVRSKYFNYTIQTSKYAFHTQLFQQFQQIELDTLKGTPLHAYQQHRTEQDVGV